jgi:peptidyl-prolyl cis-trans isomerase B (cyclophilin B)
MGRSRLVRLAGARESNYPPCATCGKIPSICVQRPQTTQKGTKRMSRTAALILAGFLAVLPAAAAATPAVQKPTPPTKEELARYATAQATITTKFGTIVVKFFPDLAPMHVKNFISLAEAGFYNGTPFHRVIPGFMIQGGDPTGSGAGGPGYTIPAEFSLTKKHLPGILSMARTNDPNSAGSQFFIMVAPYPSLDGQYSIFGEVVKGMDTVNKIVSTPRDRNDKPLERVDMINVKVTYPGKDAAPPAAPKKK